MLQNGKRLSQVFLHYNNKFMQVQKAKSDRNESNRIESDQNESDEQKKKMLFTGIELHKKSRAHIASDVSSRVF